MRIVAISPAECREVLQRINIGRLACSLDNQPYIVPVSFSFEEPDRIYVFSTVGKKIKWMRQNPKVCLEVDEIGNSSNWLSVVVNGTYLELTEPEHTAQKQHAMEALEEFSLWWRTPLAQRREQVADISIEPVFFRIDIESMNGLRAKFDAD
jgi:uncharacterized protein